MLHTAKTLLPSRAVVTGIWECLAEVGNAPPADPPKQAPDHWEPARPRVAEKLLHLGGELAHLSALTIGVEDKSGGETLIPSPTNVS